MSDTYPVLDDEFAASIGRLTLTWARIELAIDISTIAIFHRYGGSTLEKELPRSLDRKLRFLKDAFNKLPALTDGRDRAVPLFQQIGAASDFRHDIVHGIAANSVNANLENIPMTRMLREATFFRPKHFSTSAEEINQEAVRGNALSKKAFILMEALLSKT